MNASKLGPLTSLVTFLVFGCSVGAEPGSLDGGQSTAAPESVASVEDALTDPACYDACRGACTCTPGMWQHICWKGCHLSCTRACCVPSCSGKACGESDGCTGICTQGACPGGSACGAAGVAGQCAPAPDLFPFIDGTLQLVGFNSRRGRYRVTIHNLGPAPATNVKLLLQTNSPAGLLNLVPSGGFACYMPSGYFPRFGMECVGGTVPAFSTVTIELLLSFSVPGANVLALNVDPNLTITELDESNNLTNHTLMVP